LAAERRTPPEDEPRLVRRAGPDDGPKLGEAVQDVSERVSLLVREEIELAKAEVSQKVSRLVRGAVVGVAAGIFAIVGLLFLLNSLAWGLAELFDHAWLGFLVTAMILFLLGGLAGFLAYRAVKAGAPPTPDMAIEEAKRIRQTVSSSS
jgi:uncharacterized membrane protein YqjE